MMDCSGKGKAKGACNFLGGCRGKEAPALQFSGILERWWGGFHENRGVAGEDLGAKTSMY